MRYLNNFNLISALLILFCMLFLHFVNIPQNLLESFVNISIALIVFAMIFSFYFSKSKLFVLLFIPLFFIFYMYYPSILNLDGGVYSFWNMYPLTLAIGFLFISILTERGLFSYYGLSKILIIFVILAINYYFIKDFSIDTREALNTKIFSFELFDFIKTNDFVLLLTFLSASFSFLISALFFSGNSEKAPAWMFITLIIPVIFFPTNEHFIFSCALSSILVIISILKDTYKMAYIDTLTNIPARRALEEEFLKLGSTYTIAMLDIDFFKKFNDKYGHDIGDEVLKLVASEIAKVKGGGKAFRYGGEEFSVVFSNKKSNDALVFLEEIRENIAKRGFVIRDENRPQEKPKEKIQTKKSKKVKLTISIGIATSSKGAHEPQSVIKNADIALYRAKEAGRNCSFVYK